MARKKSASRPKPKQTKTDIVEDAVVVDAADTVDVVETATADTDVMAQDAVSDVVVDDVPAEVAVQDTVEDNIEVVAEDVIETPADPEPPVAQGPAPRRSVVPMVFGGLIAGAIGYGAATYLPQYLNPGSTDDPIAPLAQMQTDQAGQIAALSAQIEKLAQQPAAPDLSPQLDAIAGDVGRVDQAITDISATTDDLVVRLGVLEKRPLTDSVSPEAIQAYERELEALREAVNVQRSQIEQVAADASAQIEAAKQEAAELETNAEEVAQNGIARAAVGRVLASLETGGTYAAALGELQSVADVTVPDVLVANAEDGVPTLSALGSDFPAAARAALAAARTNDGPAEGESAVSAFFKSQLGVRSTTPQEGGSADAVLSRAQGAVADGRLTDAIAEISALSDAAQAPLSDWVAKAQNRIDALAAADALATTLATN